MAGDVIRSNEQMISYGPGGEVVAVACHHEDGWVIYTAHGPGYSDPIPDDDQARRVLAAWDAKEAALSDLRRAAAAYAAARERLEDKILDADAAGVPQTQIAQASGFSRQWVRHLLGR